MKKILPFILIIIMFSSIFMYNDYVNVSGENFTVKVGSTNNNNYNNGGGSGGGGSSSRRSNGNSGYIINNTNQTINETNEITPEVTPPKKVDLPPNDKKDVIKETPQPTPPKPKPQPPQEVSSTLGLFVIGIIILFLLGLAVLLYYLFKPRKEEKDMMPVEKPVTPTHPNVEKHREATKQEVEDLMRELEEDE